MNITPAVLKQNIVIDELYSVHYFEFSKNYYFAGESHPFWEFVYVDKGEVSVVRDSETVQLSKGQIIFHKPDEFHTIIGNGKVAPNILIVTFNCDGEHVKYFENKILSINDDERKLLAQIISESENAFSSPLNDPTANQLVRNEAADPLCEQFIKLSLEWLLLSLVRRGDEDQTRQTSLVKENSQNAIFDKVVKYMETNLDKQLQLSEICHDNLVGRSYIQKLFREKTGGGVIDYFNKMKINAAKKLIREYSGNFTEISMMLGYSSIHYFSRQFKLITGMTLSEYAGSVKVLNNKVLNNKE